MQTKTEDKAKPLRVVHVITRFIRGGADENTLFTCNGQAQAGDDIHLITGYYHPEMVAKLDPKVKWHYIPSLVRDPSLNDVRCLFDLFRLLRKLKPTVVHTHESKAGVLGRLAARAVKAPVIVHGVHILPFVNMPRAKRLIYLGMERAVAPFTDSFVSVSEEMQRLCLENGLGNPEGHSWVPSGMATEQYQQAEALDLGSLLPAHLAGQARTIGLIGGHLEKRKQIGDLVEALAPYRTRDDWILLIAGEGPEQNALTAQIKALGLEDHVLLLGFRSDLPRLLATVDIVAHAAGNEGLPRVVIQATLAGKPVVSPALPGLNKVVADGRNGLLNRIDDFTALAANFMALVDDPERRVQMGRAAREVDLSPWSVGTMVSRIAQAYSDAIDRKQSETSSVKRKAA